MLIYQNTKTNIFCFTFYSFISDFPQICSLLRGGIAERGGVRVGLHIIIIVVVVIIHDDNDDDDDDDDDDDNEDDDDDDDDEEDAGIGKLP